MNQHTGEQQFVIAVSPGTTGTDPAGIAIGRVDGFGDEVSGVTLLRISERPDKGGDKLPELIHDRAMKLLHAGVDNAVDILVDVTNFPGLRPLLAERFGSRALVRAYEISGGTAAPAFANRATRVGWLHLLSEVQLALQNQGPGLRLQGIADAERRLLRDALQSAQAKRVLPRPDDMLFHEMAGLDSIAVAVGLVALHARRFTCALDSRWSRPLSRSEGLDRPKPRESRW